MPLPDERPRQSVANLIGRFEKETKRLSVGSPSRSSSVVSQVTNDSTKEEVREKREWPPKPLMQVEKPPIIIPTSINRYVPLSIKTHPSNQSTTPDANPWRKDASTSHTEPNAEVPLTAKALDASQRQAKDGTTSFLENWRKELPAAEVEPEPAQLANVEPIPEADASLPTPTPASVQVFPALSIPHTPVTTKVAIPQPTITKVGAKAPPTTPRVTSKSTPRSTAPKGSLTPASTKPLKPQHTGQSVASTASTRKPVAKVPPSTPSRAKAPSQPDTSRAKTPTSTRPKTPSSGLFAPTAASLARSRNAPPPVPTPVKKATLSSDAMSRLSKPTAASLSKARSSTSTLVASPPRPPASTSRPSAVKGKLPVTPTRKPRTSAIPKPAIGSAVVMTIATVDVGMAESKVELIDSVSEKENTSSGGVHDEDLEALGHNDEGTSGGSGEPTPKSPTPALLLEQVFTAAENMSLSIPAPLSADEVKPITPAMDDLVDIVNLLEGVSYAKPTLGDDLPDDLLEIPDEDEK